MQPPPHTHTCDMQDSPASVVALQMLQRVYLKCCLGTWFDKSCEQSSNPKHCTCCALGNFIVMSGHVHENCGYSSCKAKFLFLLSCARDPLMHHPFFFSLFFHMPQGQEGHV
jgi:hypothetical protein